jgi:hypothetical protein
LYALTAGPLINWKDPESFLLFLNSCQIGAQMIRTQSDRFSNPLPVGIGMFMDFSDRQTVFKSCIDQWYTRQQWFELHSELDKTTAPLVAVPGSPGMGKSTMLDVLAAGTRSSESFRRAKQILLEHLKSSNPDSKFADFCCRLSNAMAVSVTFNSGSPRALDQDIIPDPVRALFVRLLWSHFCPSVLFQDFAQCFAGFTYSAFSQDVIDLLLTEAGDRDIILCVDELMHVEGGKRTGEVTKAVSSVLTVLGIYCQKIPRIHIVISSLSANPLSEFVTESRRNIQFLNLQRLSDESCTKIAANLVPCWESRECVEGAFGGVTADVARQFVRDTAGVPRLLQFVIEALRTGDARDPSQILDKIWNFMGKLPSLFGVKLLDPLKMALSGKSYSGQAMDVYFGCGLFVQSQGSRDLGYPCIPPILFKMLYRYAIEEARLDENSMERKLLYSCHVFLGLDTFWVPIAPYFFEKQVAHLFRIRLLLSIADGHDSFTLQDLVGTPQFLWQRNDGVLYPLDKTSVFPVHQLSQEELEDYVSQTSSGAFYLPSNPSFPAVDFILHLSDGTLVLVQVKYSAEDAMTCVSTKDVAECLSKLTEKHKFLQGRKMVFVFFALREGRQSFSLEKVGVDEKVPAGCMEMAVLFNKQARSILPYSLSLRPHLS